MSRSLVPPLVRYLVISRFYRSPSTMPTVTTQIDDTSPLIVYQPLDVWHQSIGDADAPLNG